MVESGKKQKSQTCKMIQQSLLSTTTTKV